MSAGHTPGPWEVHQRPTRPREYGHHVIADGGLTVCSVTYQLPDKYGETERIANARLIAAAPLLLQELRGASTQMEMAAECIEAGRYDEALLHVRSMSRSRRAAIAAATGTQL